MNRILLCCVALGAMTSAAVAEPFEMTAAQMDGVTAGAGFGAGFAGALAFGDLTKTRTNTWGTAVQKGPVGVGVGVGFGSAIGAGAGAGAAADSDAAAGGTIGVARTVGVGVDLPGLSTAQSLSVAVGVDLGGLL